MNIQIGEPDTEIPMWVLRTYTRRVTDVFAGRLGLLRQITDVARDNRLIKNVCLALCIIPYLMLAYDIGPKSFSSRDVMFFVSARTVNIGMLALAMAGGFLFAQAVFHPIAYCWLRAKWRSIAGERYSPDSAFDVLRRSASTEFVHKHGRGPFYVLRDVMVLLGKDAMFAKFEYYQELEEHEKYGYPALPDFDALTRRSL